jgi:DNA-binding CsgD family transcriptional regulator
MIIEGGDGLALSGALRNRLPESKSAAYAIAKTQSRIADRPALQTIGFTAFLLWLFQFPRIAVADSFAVYSDAPLLSLPFVVAFGAFALLARARKLPRIHMTMTLASVVAVAVGFYFTVSPSSIARVACFVAIMVLAAYFLVAWGSILRNMTLSSAFLLIFTAMCISGAIQLIFALYALGTDMVNVHTYAVMQLLPISLMPLLSGLYFFRTSTQPSEKHGFSKSDSSVHAGMNWKSGEFMPFVVILLIGSILLHFINGFTFSPFMFNGMHTDLIRAVVEIALALLVLLLVRFNARPTASSIKFAFTVVLLMTIIGVTLLLIGETGVFYSWGVLVALGDVFLCFALVFCVSPSDGGRSAFFTRYIIALLGSGFFWAYGLGNMTLHLHGYDLRVITSLAVVTLAVLAALLLFAASKTAPNSRSNALVGIPTDATICESQTPAADSRTIESVAAPIDTLQNERVLEAPTTRDVIERYRENLSPYELTERELQVALLMVKGHSAKTAGSELEISYNTIMYHLKHTYKKCGVANRGALVALITQGTEDAWQ